MWFRLHGVNEIGKFDCVLNKEHRHVVADEVVVPFLRIKLHCETPDITGEVGRTS